MLLPAILGKDLRSCLPIELPRLVLRLPTVNDTPAMLFAIEESRLELDRWMPWAPATRDVGTLKRYARRLPSALRGGKNFDFGVFERSSGAYLGGMGFAKIDPDTGVGEIGYWIRRAARRHGVVTRVVIALCTFGFDRLCLGRVEIRCDERNLDSARIPEKLGFTLDGTLRGGLPDHNDFTRRRNVRVYGLLANEWDTLAAGWQTTHADPFDQSTTPVIRP